jgi:glutamyl-tRNA synthetase/glutamyl-Q tRNA(Asp) synthetase
VLRLEDLDYTRLRPGQREAMLEALAWLGLDWDALVLQSELGHQHEAALDALQAQGLLYPCFCSRSDRKALGRRTPDGGFAYGNHCRDRPMPNADWRACQQPLRVRLPDSRVALIDGSGIDLSQTPAVEMGDPIVRRSDGVIAYHLVVVVDDAASEISHVVRGRDLANSTATQIHLQTLLGYPHPQYRHHFLLLETREQKLAKLHGSLPFGELKTRYSGPEFCGVLAKLAGLRDTDSPCVPAELVSSFDWRRVRADDLLFE